MKEKEMRFEINGREYSVIISEFDAYKAVVAVNGKKFTVGIKDLGIEQIADVKPRPVHSAHTDAGHGATTQAGQESSYHRPESVLHASSVVSPLPGLIQRIFVRVGETVKIGQPVLILEAMKMENEITSNSAGIVSEIKCREGDSVPEGAVLIVLG
jgi:biotin carboxyl carrier protein